MTQKQFFKQAGEELLKLKPLAHDGQSNFIDILVNEGNDCNDIPMSKAFEMLQPYIGDANTNICMPPREYRIWQAVYLAYTPLERRMDYELPVLLSILEKRVEEILDRFDDRPKM